MALDVPPEEVQALVNVGDQGLLLRQAKAHRGQDPGDLLPQRFGVLAGAFDHQAPVVGIPDQPVRRLTLRAALGAGVVAERGASRSLGDVLVQDRQGYVAQQRGQDRPLRTASVGLAQQAFLGEDACLQERLHQGQHALVSDSRPHPRHERGMRDFVEAGFDVALNHPLVVTIAGGEVAHLGHGVMSPAHRAEPVGAREEIRLEDRLQHQFQGCLDDPVGDGGNAQAAQLAVRLGNHPLPYWQRPETAVLQRGPQVTEEVPGPGPHRDGGRGAAIHPRCLGSPVRPHPIPGDPKERGIGDEVEQVIEPSMRIFYCPTVQLGLDLQYPAQFLRCGLLQFAGIHRRIS
jgi:hypothetical protein